MNRSPDDKTALLRWHLDVGVDETVGDRPVDRYAREPEPPATEPVPAPAVAPIKAPKPTAAPARPPAASRPAQPTFDGAVRDAVTAAHDAKSLDDLRRALETFHGCPLSRTATNLVFGDGSPDAVAVLIGEAPGAEEDRRGLPFVGPSGRLLDRMLASIGLDRESVFISNTVFWRPPGNRNPTSGEIAASMPFVERIIELIAPRALVALGGPAATSLLGRTESVGKLRGRWFPYSSPGLVRPVEATATFHPAYLLRSPAQKRLAWRDMLAIHHKLASPD